jgi:16S rRNA (cytidine1402-2'-O)-methyltransferase
MAINRARPVYTINGQVFEAPALAPGLHLVATPLGHLGDISLRALGVLTAAGTVLCEDTRITSRLLQRYSISTRLRPYHDHNAARVRPAILDELAAGGSFALVSDAGMPAISDPGYKLVRECIDRGMPVDVIPGPTAPVTALALSGLPTDRFLFAGFLPHKQGQRLSTLRELADVPATLIFFETAPRLAASLRDIASVLPGRQVAVARELTKLHQEILRGTAEELASSLDAAGKIKGEITLLVGPPQEAVLQAEADIEQRLRALLDDHSASKAAAIAARETGLPRAQLYDRAMKLKEAGK